MGDRDRDLRMAAGLVEEWQLEVPEEILSPRNMTERDREHPIWVKGFMSRLVSLS